jgi:uncharacterized membrane protein YesL
VASRAEPAAPEGLRRVPHAPLGSAVRAALTDYYFNSMRLVPANVVWGAGMILVVIVALAWPPGGLALLPLIALPTAGIFRLAARIVRGASHAGWQDIAWPYRHALGSTIVVGAIVVIGAIVLATNVVNGLGQGGLFGLVLATLAAWGLVALWCGTIVVWPLVVDPARATVSLRERVRLAGALLLFDPIRFGALGLVVAAVTVVSIVLTAAILTVSVSFIALVACRIVYPAADRFETALGVEHT